MLININVNSALAKYVGSGPGKISLLSFLIRRSSLRGNEFLESPLIWNPH